MYSGPTIKNEGDLYDLKQSSFKGVLADGALSSGKCFEIRFSAKCAVVDGLHLLITFPGSTVLTEEDQVECFEILNRFASQHPLAQRYGYRYAQNFGGLLNRPEPHAHAIIPGSAEEQKRAPRIIDQWTASS